MDNIKIPERRQNSHKGTFGKVLNIAGSPNFSGAAFLSSMSALKVGCGYVALASCPSVLQAVASMTPDVVLVPIKQVRNVIKNYDVVSFGCGFSTEAPAILMYKSIMTELAIFDMPVVLDADGINLLAKFKKIVLPDKLILTPHPKEASRLLERPVEDILDGPHLDDLMDLLSGGEPDLSYRLAEYGPLLNLLIDCYGYGYDIAYTQRKASFLIA